MKKILLILVLAVSLGACKESGSTSTSREAKVVQMQQSQYEKGQPVPVFDYSLERELVSLLYSIRNENILTHSVWRSQYGKVLGDCASMGYGIPYDVSLTNPLVATDIDQEGEEHFRSGTGLSSLASVEQPEPNGIFASKNTNATWVMCLGAVGELDPVYVEAVVNVYPYEVTVNYATDRVIKKGKSSVSIKTKNLNSKGVTTELKVNGAWK